ncbi:hypothetical protein L3X38_034109 [Prunus dulcis]|uniref:Reverse transcriptase domain-containing protein n=1 Tax=Prunus dulcis TaxID=3755 RepID=A0AAD4VJF1_PRUDU|nr:hypothetical protein L3X38_034109 [Prunus dulcis]
MCKLVSPNQVSFVPGRQISDNILIAQEVLHRFHRARGKTEYVAWKIDLSKAYDRFKWSFIEQTLAEVGIGETPLQLIMSCVKNVSYKFILNGELTESFKPQRGVRQGDPLSPYLFVLCMEKLSHIIAARVLKKEWKAVRAARSGHLISHLFFADDLILFGEASAQQAMVLKNSLEEFCELFGQQVNFEKSLLYISANTKSGLVDQIELTCGATRSADMRNYLGVPLVQGRVTKATYKGLLVLRGVGFSGVEPDPMRGVGISSIWGDDMIVRTGWNIKKLLQALLPEAVKQIISIHVDVEGNLPDTCIWGPTLNGVFSVKTAYELSVRFNEVPGSPWNFIWNLKIPPRVKCSLGFSLKKRS